MVAYYINEEHWDKFFKEEFKTTTRQIMGRPMTETYNMTVVDALKKIGASPIYGKTLMGETYVKGANFQTEEDLLYFKLKF